MSIIMSTRLHVQMENVIETSNAHNKSGFNDLFGCRVVDLVDLGSSFTHKLRSEVINSLRRSLSWWLVAS